MYNNYNKRYQEQSFLCKAIWRTLVNENTQYRRNPTEVNIICILIQIDLCGRTGSWRSTYPRPTKRDYCISDKNTCFLLPIH